MTYHSTLYVMQTRFFVEAFMLVLASIRKSNVMFFINFKDNLQFTLKVMVQQFKVLCFIFSTAPRVFTKVFTLVSTWIHQWVILLLHYLDSWLVISELVLQLLKHNLLLIMLYKDLKTVINQEK